MRTRTNSDHFFDSGNNPQNSGDLESKQRLLAQKPVVKFHSALNSIGKRDCSGIKPRRLDFGSINASKPVGGGLISSLKTGDLKKIFKGPSTQQQNGFFVSPKKEGNKYTPVKQTPWNLCVTKELGDDMECESPNPPQLTVKKEKDRSIPFLEGNKTQSGRKKKEGPHAQTSDKRSSSLSTSLFVPTTLDFNSSPNNNQKQGVPMNRKDSVILRWMRNDDIFKGKYSHVAQSPVLERPNKLFLGRSNSDVCTIYESDGNFNTRMEQEKDQGKNKFMGQTLGHFKAPAPVPIRHKDIIAHLNNEERKNKLKHQLPRIQEDEEMSTYTHNLFQKKNTISSEKFDEDCSMDQENNIQNPENDFFTFKLDDSMEIESEKNSKSNLANKYEQKLNFQQFQNPSVSRLKEFVRENMDEEVEDYSTPKLKPKKVAEDGKTAYKDRNIFFDEDNLQTDEEINYLAQGPVLHKQSNSFQELQLGSQMPQYPHRIYDVPGNNFNRFDNDFEVVSTLGSGNFGKVYKCRNKLDGLFYAVKITTKSIQKSNLSFAVNEALALASLNARYDNPNIVRFYNAWYEEDRLHLVMEYCKGSISDIAKKGERYTESMVRHIVRDICSGLNLLHEMGIVHLDIKPDNILFSLTNKYKLADLGLSRLKLRVRGEDINEGDVRYMAPELLQEIDSNGNIPDLTKADIFSMGITIFELMTGLELPKNGPVWHSLRNGDEVKRLKNCNFSNSLKSLVAQMMDPNPSKRPTAKQILKNHLPSQTELELRMVKKEINILRSKIQEYEELLKINKVERKNSY